MEEIKLIPREILCIIPKFDGDEKLLNLFINKSEYIIRSFQDANNNAQNLYVYHAITSRLIGKAASLLSDYQNITSWTELKEILTQHFGDPRSEECIALELEGLKIKQGESYIQFCHRIQNVKSSLFSKVNRLTDEGVKAAKMIIYNNTALNVFLYNLPEDMIRIVRLRGCTNLENALSVVTEEVNFIQQYNAKISKPKPITQNTFQNPLKPNFSTMPLNQNFKYGSPQQPIGYRPNFAQQPRPNLMQPPRPNFIQQLRQTPQAQGYKFGTQSNNNHQLRPFQNSGYKFGIPNQQTAQPRFKFGIQHAQAPNPGLNSDVSMRTAPMRQNVTHNLYYCDEPNYENYDNSTLDYNEEAANELYEYTDPEVTESNFNDNNENFPLPASDETVK
ncbi:uncharacterized protein LOC123701475 [Colias croceus]|uniref:uncharacterized protein LOC123701475 n=1 Tax=Colias crocea TaxID=72248 RepID=UPI001E280F06|nr:uncharacterized protein LOC123701475 [Colias croceus]